VTLRVKASKKPDPLTKHERDAVLDALKHKAKNNISAFGDATADTLVQTNFPVLNVQGYGQPEKLRVVLQCRCRVNTQCQAWVDLSSDMNRINRKYLGTPLDLTALLEKNGYWPYCSASLYPSDKVPKVQLLYLVHHFGLLTFAIGSAEPAKHVQSTLTAQQDGIDKSRRAMLNAFKKSK